MKQATKKQIIDSMVDNYYYVSINPLVILLKILSGSPYSNKTMKEKLYLKYVREGEE